MVFEFIEKHPVGFAFLMCLLLFLTASIFYGVSAVTEIQASYFIVTLLLAFCPQGFNQRIAVILLSLILFLLFFAIDADGISYLLGECGILTAVIMQNKTKKSFFIFGIIITAFLLHLYYIQNTPVNIRQHDLNGIILYMSKITQHSLNITGFDPWYMYYLFHQPLHFLIAGYVFAWEVYFGDSNVLALEGLQYLSLLYVTVATIVTAGILKELNIKGKAFSACLILFAFNPTLTLLSGYISDDASTILWSVIVIYFIILWFKKEQTLFIVCAAVGFGLGVLTKLSVLMMVPALGFIFIYKLISAKTERQKIIQQISLFIIIAVPLALLWIIRNHILFDMQFYNIPDTSPAGQNFKYMSLTERIGDFSMLFKPFINAPTVSDANIFLALIKTELFGEWDFSLVKPIVYIPAFILYVLNIFIKLLAVAGCLTIFRKSIIKHPVLGMMVILYLTIWIYALKYALDYPYVCSTDFRLFAQLILPEIILLFTLLGQKIKSAVFLTIAVFYAALASFVYIFGI